MPGRDTGPTERGVRVVYLTRAQAQRRELLVRLKRVFGRSRR